MIKITIFLNRIAISIIYNIRLSQLLRFFGLVYNRIIERIKNDCFFFFFCKIFVDLSFRLSAYFYLSLKLQRCSMASLSLFSFFCVTQLSWRWGEEKRNTGVTAVAAAAVVAVVFTSVADKILSRVADPDQE